MSLISTENPQIGYNISSQQAATLLMCQKTSHTTFVTDSLEFAQKGRHWKKDFWNLKLCLFQGGTGLSQLMTQLPKFCLCKEGKL